MEYLVLFQTLIAAFAAFWQALEPVLIWFGWWG